jgi:hypothetical protein
MPNEAVFNLAHYVREALKEIRLEVLDLNDSGLTEFPKTIIQHRYHFIHTLHIANRFI